MKPLALAALIALGSAIAPLPALAHNNVGVFIGVAPPAPLIERIPAPRHGYVWAPGYWQWNGYQYVWTSGYWVVERPGYFYNAPLWFQSNGHWALRPGGWAPYGGHVVGPHGRRFDEDHDGIPNRFDRDRDGDGVPNRFDRRPDNAYRR